MCVWFAALNAAGQPAPAPHQRIVMQNESEDKGYTINFKNVSVIEFIQFVSKVAGVNFMFEEEDLDFNVTVVSEEPTNITNVVSALIQVLRANNFNVLDQGDNLIITKQPGGAKLAQVISDEVPFDSQSPPQLITRVFKIRNANPSQLGALITPMLSSNALVEVSASSRHLIVTDITGNVDKIADLMLTLDAPQSALDIDAYKAQNASPQELVEYAKRIVIPIAEGNPVILVPQEHTSNIFVISTPYLVERTMAILQDLDTPVQLNAIQKAKLLSNESFLLYKIKYKPFDELEDALQNVSQHLQEKGFPKDGLIRTINEMNYIEDSNSILFGGSPEVLDKLKLVLADIDAATTEQRQIEISNEFLMYHPKYRSGQELLLSVQDVAASLQNTKLTDPDFLHALESARWVASTNSLVFTGDPKSLSRVNEMLTIMDQPTTGGARTYQIYKAKNVSGQVLIQDLNRVAANLSSAGGQSPEIIQTIKNVEYIPATNSLLVTGPAEAVDHVMGLLEKFDVSRGSQASKYFMYKPVVKSAQQIQSDLQDVAEDMEKAGLANPDLINTINTSRYVEATNSILFTG
ncbi:MAG: hypothetical protein KDK44_05605, partial [Chlamydiia bacterium]|nr:hypothetical protein [Chlamydiia bacterium]